MVLKMTISKAWAVDFVWSSVGNFLLYAKFSLSGGIQHGVLNIRYMKGAKKIICASNERQSSGDTGTIIEYTDVTGPNQSESSWDIPPVT